MYNACNRLPRQGNGHLLPTDVFVLFFFCFFFSFYKCEQLYCCAGFIDAVTRIHIKDGKNRFQCIAKYIE